MSVTFTITNNRSYCDAAGLTRRETYDCQCEGRVAHCVECGGSGNVVFRTYPFEMNLANGNAQTLLSALALVELGDVDLCGQIDAAELLRLLNTTDVDLVTRAGSDTGGSGTGRARVITQGIDGERAASYFERLRLIAVEAVSRGQDVEWS